jgi:hypothetical protein
MLRNNQRQAVTWTKFPHITDSLCNYENQFVYLKWVDIFIHNMQVSKQTKNKLLGLSRKRTIPTERPPLVGEVSANIFG